MTPALSALLRAMLSVALLLVLLAPSQALAEKCEPPDRPEPSLGEQVDGWFGSWVVSPIASVLFFDLMFWDNTLPMGDFPPIESPDVSTPEAREEVVAVELERRGPELMGFDADRGYLYRCRTPARLRDATPVIGEGATLKKGILKLSLAERDGELYGSWEDRPIDPAAAGLASTASEGDLPSRIGRIDEEGQAIKRVEVSTIAPFPVRIDTDRELLLAGEVRLSWSEIPVEAGQQVRWNGEIYDVAAAEGRRLSLRALPEIADPTPLRNPSDIAFPLVVIWLVLGAIFFTFRFAFINLRAFGHAIAVVSGKYAKDDDPGEVSSFQALSSALSATVGLGNIAGVAVAVSMGGPGAVVWMVIAAFFGMSSKFIEVTLGQMYRTIRPDGTVSGGPMRYLSVGLKEMGLGKLGMVLAVAFSVMCIGGSLGGGNMFQGNQSFQALSDVAPALKPRAEGEVVFDRIAGVDGEVVIPERTALSVPGGPVFLTLSEIVLPAGEPSTPVVPVQALRGGGAANVEGDRITEIAGLADNLGRITPTELDDQLLVRNVAPTAGGSSYGLFYGILLTFFVGLVIIGGIKRIGATAGYIVPAMGVLYVVAGLYIVAYQGVVDSSALAGAFSTLIGSAFSLEAGAGGLIGVLMTGFQRASFSNEAGVGSASIAHSAAATPEPVSEGIVALLEPFIDTIVVCTITGLVVVTTESYLIAGIDGISMTSAAFESGGLPGARYVLAGAVVLFAFSTMISWSYYGERAATWLFGPNASIPYKVLFLSCAIAGPVITLGNVMDFSDLMVLGMAFPNILGLYLLSGKVSKALKAYLGKLKAGQL